MQFFTLPQLALGFGVALVLIVLEYFLTVKVRSPLWGGILPLGMLVLTVCAFTLWQLPMTMQTILPFAIVDMLLFGEWSSGRQAWQELHQNDRPGPGKRP